MMEYNIRDDIEASLYTHLSPLGLKNFIANVTSTEIQFTSKIWFAVFLAYKFPQLTAN